MKLALRVGQWSHPLMAFKKGISLSLPKKTIPVEEN
jgi:hypothetical protein